jgi:hypothetical protein
LIYNQRDEHIHPLGFGFTITKEFTFMKIDLKTRKLLKRTQNYFKVFCLV